MRYYDLIDLMPSLVSGAMMKEYEGAGLLKNKCEGKSLEPSHLVEKYVELVNGQVEIMTAERIEDEFASKGQFGEECPDFIQVDLYPFIFRYAKSLWMNLINYETNKPIKLEEPLRMDDGGFFLDADGDFSVWSKEGLVPEKLQGIKIMPVVDGLNIQYKVIIYTIDSNAMYSHCKHNQYTIDQLRPNSSILVLESLQVNQY